MGTPLSSQLPTNVSGEYVWSIWIFNAFDDEGNPLAIFELNHGQIWSDDIWVAASTSSGNPLDVVLDHATPMP